MGSLRLKYMVEDYSHVTIPFSLDRPQPVHLTLFDALGRAVRTVTDEVWGAGDHEIALNLGGLPAGRYTYRLRTDDGEVARSVTVVR